MSFEESFRGVRGLEGGEQREKAKEDEEELLLFSFSRPLPSDLLLTRPTTITRTRRRISTIRSR